MAASRTGHMSQLAVCVFAVIVVSCSAVRLAPGATTSVSFGRHLLANPDAPLDSKPPNPNEPCYADLPGPGGYASLSDAIYMTATSKCPNDNFTVSIVDFEPNVTYAGSYGEPISGPAKHQWTGPYWENPSALYISILRQSDGKLIIPKGIKPDGSFYDISGTARKVCLLFAIGSKPLDFGGFRARMSADGLNVRWDDFYSSKFPSSIPDAGVPCDQYVDPTNPDSIFVGKYGRVVDVYRPGGCRFGIDDCST